LVDGGEEVFGQLGGEGADAVEVGGGGVWGEAAEEVAGGRGSVGVGGGEGEGGGTGRCRIGCLLPCWGIGVLRYEKVEVRGNRSGIL